MTFYTHAWCVTICQLMPKNWNIAPQESEDILNQLFINRGLQKKEDIERFLSPKLKDFEKDLEIPGIKKTQKRMLSAIEKGEQIIVYGDYDVDGVCASAVIYKALSSLGAKVLPYIPHREKEGYGLSKQGLDYCKDIGASLVITVDHGIVALEMCEYAKKIGLELIITDHHTPKETKPPCDYIVHTTTMCGTAVAWCIVREIIDKTLTQELLELVALATICDMIPLLGVNRSLVKEGLLQINKTSNTGLKALIKEAGIELGHIDSYALGHYLGPRLNAIGRLEHAIDALRLLCTKDPIKANKLAKLLTDANNKRKELTQQAMEEARFMIDETHKVHMLHSEAWIPGIIGLIAGRSTEEYGRPSIAISVGEIHSKGSARSVDGINITETIRNVSHLLVDVGGHKGAAGFTLETVKLEEFKNGLKKIFEKIEVSAEQYFEIEATVPPKLLTKTLARQIGDLEPFGFGNPFPILATLGMKISDIRTVGEGKHLKFKADGIDAIAFGMGSMKDILRNGQITDIAYNLEINKFNGRENLQLKVKDIRT